jgi:Zn-dependent protease with chaperone function
MKYHAALPERNDNVSDGHPLKEFFLLLGAAAGLLIALYVVLGFFVDYAVDYVSPETEVRIFAAAGMLWEPGGAPDTEQQQQSLQTLVDQLATCLDTAYPITLRIAESEQVNAFAVPGGTVVLNSGLLDKVRSENGVAFVLAHELAHFQNRDHLRSLGRSIVLLAMLAVLTGADADLSRVLAPISDYENAQFSQDRESAADATALRALNCHYGHVGGATELFEVIATPDDDSDFALTHYFSSHPEARQRVDDLRQLSESLGFDRANNVELRVP